MSSESRSSSAVRNLRSIFENKASENGTADSRGRSPNGLSSSDKENSYKQPKGKVRASFVAVGPAPTMAAPMEHAKERRGSFGEADGDLELRKTVSEQQDELGVPDEVAIESMPPSVAATPLKPPNFGQLGHDAGRSLAKVETEPDNPDKIVTGAEEEPGEMKPADPADEAAVSGGDALPPVAEDLTSTNKPTPSQSNVAKKLESKKTPTSGKPPSISTKTTAKPPSGSITSPASQPKTPLTGNASSSANSPVTKKTSRSSLTAPTAASIARSGNGSDKPKTSPPQKAKPREVTKPVNLPSHLTAPTASSKAKHEPETAASSSSSFRASLSARPKPQVPSTKLPARSSLAAGHRPDSRGSQMSGRRSLAAVDGSFLDRMTRPTAASSGHRHEKIVAKSPPKSKPSTKPKVNGHISKKAGSNTTPSNAATEETRDAEPGADIPETSPQQGLTFAGNASNAADAIAAAHDEGVGGNETPIHHPMDQADGALEATPAGLGGEETIR